MINSHFARLDGHMQEVMRGVSLALVLKVVGAGLGFAFNVAIARLLGAEGAGLYFLALSVTAIGSVIGRVGLDNALLRFVATHAAHEAWGKVKGVYALGMRLAIAASGSLSLLGFLLAPWIAQTLFHKPELSEPLRWMSLSILPFALLNLQAESLKGLKRIRDAMLVQSIGVPLVGLLLIVPLAQSSGVLGVGLAYLAGTALVAALGIWAWHRAVAVHEINGAEPFPFKELWASCRPLLLVSVMNGAILPWMPLFLLGVWAASEEVGIFGAALRVGMLVSFFLVAVNNVVVPKFAGLYARGEIVALGRVGRNSALLLTVLASPVLLIMMFMGDRVMSLYGEGFSKGKLVLAILAFGQFVNAFCGPVGNLLTMSGNERKLRDGTLVTLVVQLTLCAVLIPWFGMEGAAVATAAGVISNNLIAVFHVRRLIGIAYPVRFGGHGV